MTEMVCGEGESNGGKGKESQGNEKKGREGGRKRKGKPREGGKTEGNYCRKRSRREGVIKEKLKSSSASG